MTPTEFRAWVDGCIGKSLTVRPGFANQQGGVPPNAAANGSHSRYLPVTVQRQQIVDGFGNVQPHQTGMELAIANSSLLNRHGVYVTDAVNQCTSVNADANSGGIVISGQFSGCTFARCTNGGNTFVGHIYVDGGNPGNDPSAQARAFEVACGAVPNSAVGFSTIGQLHANAPFGYVIGTRDGGVWQWNWIGVTNAQGFVLQSSQIPAASWVAL